MTSLTIYDKATGEIQRVKTARRSVLQKEIKKLDLQALGYVWGDATDITNQCVVDGVIVRRDWSPEDLKAQQLQKIKRQRDAFLAATDWTQVPDAPIDQKAWGEYREQLRSIENLITETGEVRWPRRPEVSVKDRINTERDRRLTLGKTFELPSYGSVSCRGLVGDIQLLNLLVNRAGLRQTTGDPQLTIYKDRDNIEHSLTSEQVISLGIMLTDWIEAVAQASWQLKKQASDLDPSKIPGHPTWP